MLPGLLLARVDGKSPVEYLDESEQDQVRDAARVLLNADYQTLAEVTDFWRSAVLR